MDNYLFSFLKNEKGVTLLELLASMLIFMLVIIPLSDIYLDGITVYNKTQAQTNLRNEADYVLSIVMKKIQDASYYELRDNPDTNPDRNRIYEILEKGKVGDVLDDEDTSDHFKTDLVTYRINVDRDDSGKTVSTVTKDIYNLFPGQPNTLYQSESFLAYGLFKLDKDAVDPNHHKITVYLLIAPKSKTEDAVYLGDQRSAFFNLEQIFDTVDKNKESDPHFEYIRMIKTEISTNNVNQG